MAEKYFFTVRKLNSLKPAPAGKRYTHWDTGAPGLCIRVSNQSSPEAIGTFGLLKRFPGSSNPVFRAISTYSALMDKEGADKTLAKAREKAREWLEDIKQGIDPAVKEAERRRAEQAQRADTVRAAFDDYYRQKLSKLRTAKAVKSVVEKSALNAIGDWPVKDVRRRHIKDLIAKLGAKFPIQAERLRSYLATFFNWCVDTDRMEVSPMAGLKRTTSERERARDRVLTSAEVKAIWKACEREGALGRAIQFMLVTGQRRGEVAGMRWDEIDHDEKTWRLSKARTKAKRSHEVPLSPLALAIIKACPKHSNSDFVFGTGRTKRGATDGEGAAPSGWGKAKERIDATAAALLDADDLKLADWRIHDLRRSCATNLARLGVDRIVISLILNHAESHVTGVYDRFRYDAERRRALELWAARIEDIISGAHGTVVAFQPTEAAQ